MCSICCLQTSCSLIDKHFYLIRTKTKLSSRWPWSFPHAFCWIPGEDSTETFKPCSSPAKLLLVKNQAVWPIWATEALTSFKVVAASLRFLLSCCVSVWGQQLQTELNLLLHLMALTGLCGTSGEMKLLQHLLTLTFQLILSMSCWVSSLSSFCSRNTEEPGQESMDF